MPSAGQRDAIASPGEEHGSGNGRLLTVYLRP
jgi:hypothetical protein